MYILDIFKQNKAACNIFFKNKTNSAGFLFEITEKIY